jgi:hypothetical protein
MTSLRNIEEELCIIIGRQLNDGYKKRYKNRYYYFPNEYFIVSLSERNDKWMIMNAGQRTIDLLTDHIFCCSNQYAMTNDHAGSTIKIHTLLMDTPEGLCIDHKNQNPYDNRVENLRITTHLQNMRNKRAYTNNTSNYTGIARRVINNIGIWRAFINDDNGTIEKTFSCRKYGERDAKMLAIEQRRRWKREFNYIGE